MSSMRYRPLALQALIEVAGVDAPTERKVVDSFNALSDQLTAALRQLFGPAPTRALVARSQRLAEKDYAFLHAILKQEDGRLHAGLDGQALGPDELMAALSALLAHEIDLLTMLVGEDFVLPLVSRTWPIRSSAFSPRPSH
jgi:hypothetical protein